MLVLCWPPRPCMLSTSYHMAVPSVSLAASPHPPATQFWVLFSFPHSFSDFVSLVAFHSTCMLRTPKLAPQPTPLSCTPASPSTLMPHSLPKKRMPCLPPNNSTESLPNTVQGICTLPDAPAEDHSVVLDAFPSLIPSLPSIRTPADFKIYPESSSFSMPPLHCPSHFTQRKSQGLHSCQRGPLTTFLSDLTSCSSPATLAALLFSKHTGHLPP